MVRIPPTWARAGYAGVSVPNIGGRSRRILAAHPGAYVNPVTVDLGNDGMAPVATFSASGIAHAFVGPSGSGDTWSLDQCYMSTSIGLLDPSQVTVYAGPLPSPVTGIPQYAVTGSLSGGGSQFGLGGVGLSFGWFLYAVWTGGTSGAFAYLRATGTKSALTN
jgi:hypothetical protein